MTKKKRAKIKNAKPEREGPEPMPRRFPGDHPHVLALLNESQRATELGLRWAHSKGCNYIAAQKCMEVGWAYALAGVWLRCHLKDEFERKEKVEP